MEEEPLGYLTLQKANISWSQTIPICSNQDIYVGRDNKRCRIHLSDDLTISNRHVHLYSVTFDKDDTSGMPPLVYIEDLSTNGTVLSRLKLPGVGVYVSPLFMTKHTGPVLLNDGDVIFLSARYSLRFEALHKPHMDEQDQEKHQVAKEGLSKRSYLLTSRKLGGGGQGAVYLALHSRSQRQFACKIKSVCGGDPNLDLTGLRALPLELEHHFRECDVLNDLNHPNIVNLEKVFWTDQYMYIFEELITGGDLFSYIEHRGGSLDDGEAAIIIYQVLKGIEYLHGLGIVHRDLKPDNILLTRLDAKTRVLLTDFGSARYMPQLSNPGSTLNKRTRMHTKVGTLEYTAPEVAQKNPLVARGNGYTKAVDMWSIGAIAAACVAGDVPFADRNDPRYAYDPETVVMELAASCNLSVLKDRSCWQRASVHARDFVQKLLVLDEVARLQVAQALQHPWFTHPSYAVELQAVYKQATKDWRPRKPTFNIAEPLLPLQQHEHKPRSVARLSQILSQEQKSEYFPDLPPSRQYAGCSLLTDPRINATPFSLDFIPEPPLFAVDDQGISGPSQTKDNETMIGSSERATKRVRFFDKEDLAGGDSYHERLLSSYPAAMPQ